MSKNEDKNEFYLKEARAGFCLKNKIWTTIV